MPKISREVLNEIFEYSNGWLVWMKKPSKMSNNIKIGACAGYIENNGYVRFKLFGKLRQAHRLIWEFHFGEVPEDFVVDHINGLKSDNRIENLRLLTISENNVNRFNTERGVYFNKERSKWHAQISVDGKTINLGYFDNRDDSLKAYRQLASELYSQII